MQQFVCPSCGLVNLDKFTTFPFCAACGAKLPQKPPSKARVFWTRPIRPAIFASAIGFGVSVLGLAAIMVARETRDRSEQRLVVYWQMPRSVAPDGMIYTALTLDTTSENPASSFRGVRLRVPTAIFARTKLVSLVPKPTQTSRRGDGQYFEWDVLARETPIRLALVPTQPGNLRFPVSVYASGYEILEMRVSLNVRKSDLKRAF